MLELIKENPDLPVDEYLICNKSGYLAFRSDEDVFDTLERYLDEEEFDALPEDEDACREVYNNLPWTKAIIVWIEMRGE